MTTVDVGSGRCQWPVRSFACIDQIMANSSHYGPQLITSLRHQNFNLSSDCYYEISNTKMFLKMGKPRPLFPLFLVFYNTISTEKNCRLQFSNSYCQSQRRARLTLDHPHGPRIQNSKFKINLDLHVFFHLQNYLS